MTDESLKDFARTCAQKDPDSAQLLTALVERIEELETLLRDIKNQAVVCQHLTSRSQKIKEAAVPWHLVEKIDDK